MRGFLQIEGIDYKDTFTPVAQLESVCTILVLAASMDWEIHQFDVKTAFLHRKLTDNIYMEQPEGQKEKGKETWVCKLQKSLYGLKQARCCWYTMRCVKQGLPGSVLTTACLSRRMTKAVQG